MSKSLSNMIFEIEMYYQKKGVDISEDLKGLSREKIEELYETIFGIEGLVNRL